MGAGEGTKKTTTKKRFPDKQEVRENSWLPTDLPSMKDSKKSYNMDKNAIRQKPGSIVKTKKHHK